MRRLTLEDIKAPRPVHYVETLYGSQIGLRRISAKAVLKLQGAALPDGTIADAESTNREILRASIADPEPTDDLIAWLEDDARAYLDLIRQVLAYNGLSAEAQAESARTFREGVSESETLPT